MDKKPKNLARPMLQYFVDKVHKGETPERELMEYVADGLEVLLMDDLKNWPTMTVSRGSEYQASQAYALYLAGIRGERAATIIGLIRDDATGSDWSGYYRRLKRIGKAMDDDPNTEGHAVYTLENILRDQFDTLTDKEKEQIRQTISSMGGGLFDKEPNYY